MLENRVEIKDGIEWVYFTSKIDLSKHPASSRISPIDYPKPVYYFAAYKCDRCGHTWNDSSKGTPPLNEVSCIISSCANPGFFTSLFRGLMKKKINGTGRLIKVEVHRTVYEKTNENL